jgi:hypothetical protein
MPVDPLSFTVRGEVSGQAGIFSVVLMTAQGDIGCRVHLCPGDCAVLWVFGAGGGLGGPAGGVYHRLGEVLRSEGVVSLELDYRHPARMAPCVQDVVTGLDFLRQLGKSRVVLVGHSFGGAVVIDAGRRSRQVIAVAALSSQTSGAEAVADLAPRPVLFIHGDADEILPPSCSRHLYARAAEPKEIIIYPGCRHGLDQCRKALDRDLLDWIRRSLLPERSQMQPK